MNSKSPKKIQKRKNKKSLGKVTSIRKTLFYQQAAFVFHNKKSKTEERSGRTMHEFFLFLLLKDLQSIFVTIRHKIYITSLNRDSTVIAYLLLQRQFKLWLKSTGTRFTVKKKDTVSQKSFGNIGSGT
mgnify:CR=1 FL=1